MTARDLPELDLPTVYRVEKLDIKEGMQLALELTRSMYPHGEVYGDYITVQEHVDAPPGELFDYLSDTRSLGEWTYSMRNFERVAVPLDGHAPSNADDGLWVSDDKIGEHTKIYTRTVANPGARTVDYHCAWDQSQHLWMIYLMRVIDARLVLDKPGSVVIWTNCKHPFYDDNGYPETSPDGRPVWVGDFWDLFYAGHLLELRNLKAIAEYRHSHGLSIKPDSMS